MDYTKRILLTEETLPAFKEDVRKLDDTGLLTCAEGCLWSVSEGRLQVAVAVLHNAPMMFDQIADVMIERLKTQA